MSLALAADAVAMAPLAAKASAAAIESMRLCILTLLDMGEGKIGWSGMPSCVLRGGFPPVPEMAFRAFAFNC
jgi:hypothetical protein